MDRSDIQYLLQASSLGAKLPGITPNAKCKLRLLKLERVKDWLLMEEEFVSNQERLKPQEERNEEDRTKVYCWAGTCGVRMPGSDP
jgi:26S proteasome regulatory subunit T2